jgi:hypothetical protein
MTVLHEGHAGRRCLGKRGRCSRASGPQEVIALSVALAAAAVEVLVRSHEQRRDKDKGGDRPYRLFAPPGFLLSCQA